MAQVETPRREEGGGQEQCIRPSSPVPLALRLSRRRRLGQKAWPLCTASLLLAGGSMNSFSYILISFFPTEYNQHPKSSCLQVDNISSNSHCEKDNAYQNPTYKCQQTNTKGTLGMRGRQANKQKKQLKKLRESGNNYGCSSLLFPPGPQFREGGTPAEAFMPALLCMPGTGSPKCA